jgi:hypothetical protein
MTRPYIVGTGWWCDGSRTHAGSVQAGIDSTPLLRAPEFFGLWHAFVDHYTRPEKIVIIDSASPVQPALPDDDRIEIVRLNRNYGHAMEAEPRGSMSGVERCHLSLAAYAYVNDYDLVYVEQDCLVKGDGWVESSFGKLERGKIMYGSGRGTPQPMQQSVMLFRHAYLPTVIGRVGAAWDRFRRGRWFDPLGSRRFGASPEKRWHYVFRGDVDWLPFDGGRKRPLDFSQAYLYAQHWSDSELARFVGSESWLSPDLADIVHSGGAREVPGS